MKIITKWDRIATTRKLLIVFAATIFFICIAALGHSEKMAEGVRDNATNEESELIDVGANDEGKKAELKDQEGFMEIESGDRLTTKNKELIKEGERPSIHPSSISHPVAPIPS